MVLNLIVKQEEVTCGSKGLKKKPVLFGRMI